MPSGTTPAAGEPMQQAGNPFGAQPAAPFGAEPNDPFGAGNDPFAPAGGGDPFAPAGGDGGEMKDPFAPDPF